MLTNTEVGFLGSKERKKIAIVGRPNVGKSSLFNVFVGGRPALVKDEPGVTRDVNLRTVDVWGRTFDLIDTGGVTGNAVPFAGEVREQVLRILPYVDFILFVVDGRDGLVPDDRDLLVEIKKTRKPFLILVNKIDSEKDEESRLMDFFELGEDMQPTSFENRRGIDETCEWIIAQLTDQGLEEVPLEKKIAIIGRPNVGKSSLVNYLLSENRMLVSDIAGTTIDAIDSEINWKGKKYVFTDTAGLRRSARRDTDVEVLSAYKSEDALARASIVVLMVDALEGLHQQEARLLDLILEENKAVVVAINKSDLGKKEIVDFRDKLQEEVDSELYFHAGIPRVFISAKTGQGLDQLFKVIDELWDKMHLKISTSDVNEFFGQLTRMVPPPIYGTRSVKMNYFTQTRQVPPSFIAFCNYPQGVSPSYRRFLLKELRKKWDLYGVPVRLYILKKK
jgi:GTPase